MAVFFLPFRWKKLAIPIAIDQNLDVDEFLERAVFESERLSRAKWESAMSVLQIKIWGSTDQSQGLQTAIQTRIPGANVEFVNDVRSFPQRLQKSDAFVCFVNHADQGEYTNLFHTLIEQYPHPFVPLVTVSESCTIDPRTQRPMLAARQLHWGSEAKTIAQDVWAVIDGSKWWTNVWRHGDPGLVVDRMGRITRANISATERFGSDLLNQWYSQKVENRSEMALPQGHPILEAIYTRKEISQFRKIGKNQRGTFVVCTPMFVFQKVEAVAVLLVDIEYSSPVLEAASGLEHAEDLNTLYELIVQGVSKLGYKRARLKRYSRHDEKLLGLESLGFDHARASQYSRFSIDKRDDPLAFEALEYQIPLLFIYDPAHKPALERLSLIRHYNRRLHEADLDKKDVARWIDVPLLVAIPNDKRASSEAQAVEAWGILTVDQGQESHKLAPRDARDLALYASIAAVAVSAVRNRLLERDRFCKFLEGQSALALALRNRRGEPILDRVRDLLLEMYLDITKADVAYFREWQINEMVVAGGPHWRVDKPDGVMIPREMKKGDGFSDSLLNLIALDGTIRPGMQPSPVFLDDATEITDNALQSQPNRWLQEEQEFLKNKSAIYFPVVIGGQFWGAFIAVTRRKNAFPPSLRPLVEQFMKCIQLWFEQAELHDRRFAWHSWRSSILERVLKSLGQLRELPTGGSDSGFFAGLATLLTAGSGLGWNRALIFESTGQSRVSANLVYAVGGLGAKTHVLRQLALRDVTLAELVNTRLQQPLPLGDDGSGSSTLDPLYDLCVQKPLLQGKSIEIAFEDLHRAIQESINYTVRWPVDSMEFLGVIPAIVLHKDREGWLAKLERDFPGMVCADKIYAFPLLSNSAVLRGPLGVVFVDMAYSPVAPLPELIAATRLALDEVASSLTIRLLDKRLHDSEHPNLPISLASQAENGLTLMRPVARTSDVVDTLGVARRPLVDTDNERLVEEAIAAFNTELPELMKKWPDCWVAYYGRELLFHAQTRADVRRFRGEYCQRNKIDVKSVFISRIELDMPPIYASWEEEPSA